MSRTPLLLPLLLAAGCVGQLRAGCPAGWAPLAGHCYLALPLSASGHESSRLCAEQGATLASIHDQDTNDRLLALTGHTAFWTGLQNFTGGGQGSWRWEDGSDTDFFLWAPGMPELDNGRRACVWVYEGDGMWKNDECDNLRVGSVVCQKEAQARH